MPLLDALINALKIRFNNNKPVFYAQDLGQPGEQDFITILGVNELSFISPQTSETQEGKLNINGKTSVLGLESIDIELTIEEIQDEEYDQSLGFTLKPKFPLPETWEFSQSFPDLEGTYFDNLILSEAYLIATSFDHSITAPSISLSKGINFSANTLPEQALKNLKYLCPSVSVIALQGMILRDGDRYNVNLSASAADTPIIIQPPFSLKLRHIAASENNQTIADFEGGILASGVNFPFSITIPTVNDPLDELQSTLEARMISGSLPLFDSDFGEDTAVNFYTSLGTHSLNITGASMERKGLQLVINGKTSIFHMPEDTFVQITVTENDARLDFTIIPVSFPEDWKLSRCFSQLEGSFFDQLQFSNIHMAATSYAHLLSSPAINLVAGLNFYAETTSAGSLDRLAELGDTFANSFTVQGTITPHGAFYEIVLSNTITKDIPINLVKFGTATVKQPVFHLKSIPEADNQPVSNSAFISGTLSVPSFESYPGELIVPVKEDQVYWELNKYPEYLNLPGVATLLNLYGQEYLAHVFPENFIHLENIFLSELNIIFLLGANPMSSVYAQVILPPAQDGTPRSWEILSSPRLAISDLAFALNVSYYTYAAIEEQMVFRCIFSGKISIGNTSNLSIRLMIPLQGDWELTVLPENAVLPTLSDIAHCIWPSGEHRDNDLLAPLPQGLIRPHTAINISEIKIGFNPFSQSLSYFSFLLEQEGEWQIISNVLSVSGWSVAMKVETAKSVNITGLLHGFISIGSGSRAIAHIEATLPIPAGEKGWTLCLKEGTTIEVPSFGDLLVLMGGQQYVQGIPNNLQNIGGLSVTLLSVNFVPAPPALNWFSFAMKSREEWVLIENILSIQNIETNLDIRKENEGQYNTTGIISGTIFIFNKPLWIISGRDDLSHSWILKLAAAQSIHIPGLSQLAAWMLPESILTYIPVSFMPFSQGFDLTDVNIDFNISNMSLQRIYFHIKNTEAWEVIPGYEYITIDGVIVDANITNPFLNKQTFTCRIEGTINLGSFSLMLAADKSSPEADWVLEGQLAHQAELNFEALFQKILPVGLPMPYTYGFPTAITILSAAISLTPNTGKFHFEAAATANWQFNFAFITFNINSIHTSLDLESANDTEKRLYILAAGGNVNFCGLSADLFFKTSNKAAADTILTAVITPEQIQNISLPEISDTMATGETSGDRWQTLVPGDFAQLSFSTGYIHLNLTQNQFFLYGNVTGFGSIVFLTKKLADETWGYLFALALGADFTFGSLFSGLSVIDGFLTVNNSGIFLSSFEESSSTLIEEIKSVCSFPENPADFSLPLPINALPENQLHKGIYFYADLEFPAASLLGTIFQIGNAAAGLSRIIISAFIAADNSLNTIFSADLPDITILNTITFTHTNAYSGIHLEYTAQNSQQNQFRLIGRINLSLFSHLYSFDGTLAVNEEKIESRLQLATDSAAIEIPMPFGIPGICFTDLYLGVNYIFSSGTTPTLCSFLVEGSVSFGQALSFSGILQLRETTPVLAVIQLDKALSIGQFFAQCVNTRWPDHFIDITFLAGSKIYYYDPACDPDGRFNADENGSLYLSGFNIDANIILTVLSDISINLTVRVIQDNNGDYKGVIIDAGLADTLDLFVLQIAGCTMDTTGKYTGGPSLRVNTVDTPMTFGFAAGLNFFQKPFGIIEVKIRKTEASNEMELLGHLESPESFDLFGKLSLDFAYSTSKGFEINNWPAFTMISDAIDFINELEDICDSCDGTVCGVLSDLATDVLFQTEFNISPSFDTKDNVLYFVLNGHYTLTLLHMQDPFVTVNFPPFMFPLPNALSLSALPGEIANSIGSASKDFVMALINNPEQIAKFLAILFGKKAMNIALDLACRGLVDGVIADAAAAAGDAVATAGGAAAAATAAAAVGAATAAVLSIISSSCFTKDTNVLFSDGTAKSIEKIKIGDTLLGRDNVHNKVVKYDQPLLGSRKLYSFNDGPYFVTAEHPFLTKDGWKSLNPQATAKENQNLAVGKLQVGDILIMSDEKEAVLDSIREKSASPDTKLYNFILEGNNTYYANGFLTHNKNPDKPDKPEPSIPEFRLLAYSDGLVTAKWQAAYYASGYEFQFISPSGKLYKELSLDIHTLEASFPVAGTLPEGSCTGKIRAVRGSDKKSEWAVKNICKLDIPAEIQISFSDHQIHVTWSAVQAPVGSSDIIAYNVRLIKDGHVINSDEIQATNTAFDVSDPGTYTAQVNALCGNSFIPGNYGVSQQSITKLSQPATITLAYSNARKQFILTWASVQNSSGYIVEIADALNNFVVSSDVLATEKVKTFPISDFTGNGGTFKARVAAKGTGAYINSSYAISQNAIEKLMLPQNITQIYHMASQSLDVFWEKVPNAAGYRIRVFDAGIEARCVADKTIDAASDNPSCTFVKEDFSEYLNGLYHVQVQALGGEQAIDSAFGTGSVIPVAVLPDLTLTFVYYDYYNRYGTILVSWPNTNPDNATYDLLLLDSRQRQVGNMISGAIDTSDFLIEHPQNNSAFLVKIRAHCGTFISDWSTGTSILLKLLSTTATLTVSYQYDSIHVSWDAVAGAAGYRVRVLDIISKTSAEWEDSLTANVWKQSFVAAIDGVITSIDFNRNSRPSTRTEPSTPAKMYLYDTENKLIGSSSFLDESGRCRVAISGKVSQGKTYICRLVYGTPVIFWYGRQDNSQVLPLLSVEGMSYLDHQGTLPEVLTPMNSVDLNLGNLEAGKFYQFQVKAYADNSEGAWTDGLAFELPLLPMSITAFIAGGVADSNGDGKGDNHSEQLPYAPMFQSASINSSGQGGCNGTSRFISKWNISVLYNYTIRSAKVILNTYKGSVDALDTFFYAITSDGGETLNDSDFESPAVQIPGAIMKVPAAPAGTQGIFAFDITDQLKHAITQKHAVFSVQGRVNESLTGQQRGLQLYTTCKSSPAAMWPQLVVQYHSTPISIVSGDQQSVFRTEPQEIPGGTAKFKPLKVKVVDVSGKPIANTAVTFTVGNHPSGMAVQITPSGSAPAIVATDSNGIATLNGMSGYSIDCYYREGNFNIIAGIATGAQVIFSLNVAPTPPTPPLLNATLTILSGNLQHQARAFGGKAKFKPLTVKLVDSNGRPVPNAEVNFSPGSHPPKMAVQVHPSGAAPATVITGKDGIATLNDMPEKTGVWCYYDMGQCTVTASVAGGAQATFTLYVDC